MNEIAKMVGGLKLLTDWYGEENIEVRGQLDALVCYCSNRKDPLPPFYDMKMKDIFDWVSVNNDEKFNHMKIRRWDFEL